MLEVVKRFQERHRGAKPIIVADAAMLSHENMIFLEREGYQYIVGARLANTSVSFINKLISTLTKQDGNTIRLPYPNCPYSIICAYSSKREKKDRREFDKQLAKANELMPVRKWENELSLLRKPRVTRMPLK